MEVNLSVTETFVHVALGLLLLSGTLVAQDYVISTVAGGTSSTPGNMAGSWQFSGQSSIFGIEFSATGQIVQVGNAISGSWQSAVHRAQRRRHSQEQFRPPAR